MATASDAAPYRILDAEGVRSFLASYAALRARLGPDPQRWRIREVGDGNLNLVFIIEGTGGAVCLKQALPYVRAAGPSWPMTPERAFFENAYFRSVAPHVGRLIPEIYLYQAELYCTVMECLSPHIILRHGLIAGQCYPDLARKIGEYVANACFFSSDLAQPFEHKLEGMALFAANKPLVRISVDLIFTDPYRASPRNRHTSPQLDAAVAALQADGRLRLAAARMGWKFLNRTEALVHGDLHSGSVMVTDSDARVIDPEFAFYGPIGFDLGAFFGNLLLSWYSQRAHRAAGAELERYRAWLVEQLASFWRSFHDRFLALWDSQAGGDAYPAALLDPPGGQSARAAARREFMAALFDDMLGFAACKMIRRIVGFAHVLDLESIQDLDRRAACEAGALAMAHRLLTEPGRFVSPEDVIDVLPQVEVEDLAAWTPGRR